MKEIFSSKTHIKKLFEMQNLTNDKLCDSEFEAL